ncbi:MAG TPA: type II toxin-antitoxin system HipA family toxin [Candidatus Binataceae bacterium]
MTSSTYVWVYLPDQTEPVVAGRLEYDDNPVGAIYSFLYGASYLNRRAALPLDPERLPLERGLTFDSSDLHGTLGVIRDASPDDWGRRVIERRLGVTEASELTYLIEAGDDRAGALGFSESFDLAPNREPPPGRTDLDILLSAAAAIEEGQPVDPAVVMLLKHGSSLGGARPKATIHMDGELWLAKFPSTKDRLEVAAIEYATLKLAAQCGIETPEIRLIDVSGRKVMLSRRFDRTATAKGLCRRHFMSGLTLLGLHEGEASRGSYPALADSIRKLVRDFKRDGAELFRRMIFNMLVSNDDDHLRNHAVIHDEPGWRLSPAYDLVPHPQSSHTRRQGIGVSSQSREATLKNALSEAARFGLTMPRATQIAARVRDYVESWETAFRHSGVPARDIKVLRTAFLPESVVTGFAEIGRRRNRRASSRTTKIR